VQCGSVAGRQVVAAVGCEKVVAGVVVVV